MDDYIVSVTKTDNLSQKLNHCICGDDTVEGEAVDTSLPKYPGDPHEGGSWLVPATAKIHHSIKKHTV